jgi:hypothetical protein
LQSLSCYGLTFCKNIHVNNYFAFFRQSMLKIYYSTSTDNQSCFGWNQQGYLVHNTQWFTTHSGPRYTMVHDQWSMRKAKRNRAIFMMNLLFEMVERGFEISTTKRKERNLSCVDILKDKIYLLASQQILNPKFMQILYQLINDR